MSNVVDHPYKDRLLSNEELERVFDPHMRYDNFMVLAYEPDGAWSFEIKGSIPEGKALWLLEKAKLRIMGVR